MSKFKQILKFFNDDTPYYAASLSFFTIFSILPLIALFIVVMAQLPSFLQHLDRIMLYLLDFINPTQSTAVAKALDGFLQNTNDLGNIGIFYLLFVFTMFFKDYEYIINRIYGTPSRAMYRWFFTYFGFLLLIPLLFFLFIFVSTMAKFSFSIHIIASFFIWVLFILLFILSANRKISFGSAALASCITLVVLSITKSLFVYYVSVNTTYVTIYGSFSVVLFFFLWIYISWNIYLYGTKLCYILNKDKVYED